MVKVLRGLAVVLLSLQVFLPFGANAEDGSPAKQILISEFQTGSIAAGAENPKGEFVELYNTGSTSTDVTGWRVEYLTKTHDGISAATRTLAVLTGSMEPGSHLLVSYEGYLAGADYYFSAGPSTGYLAKGDGSIRLVDSVGEVIDLVGYGSPNNYEELPISSLDAGKSAQRCLAAGELVDTDNNNSDFVVYEEITPGAGINCPAAEAPLGGGSSCEGVIISEVLPNPGGSDTGREFIELYNPSTEFVNLNNCGLQVGTSGIYRFSSLELAPEQYKAFYGSTTGLTLPNAAGGTVYLLSGESAELDSVSYGADLPDDVSWAWFGGEDWSQTYAPSPNEINISQPSKACAYGQIRNPETGRCVSLGLGGSSLAGSTFKPCKPGQERNPDTNRCRAAKSASASLKPCAANQTRNTETNRCRKVTLASSAISGGGIQDAASTRSSKHSLWFGGAVFAVAGGYGIWEWRRELVGFVKRFKKLPKA